MTPQELCNQILLLSEEKAQKTVEKLNERYRAGNASMPDRLYDALLLKLSEKFPDNEVFGERIVESDIGIFGSKTVPLPARMLSTQKAYKKEEIEKWADGIITVGREFGIHDVFFKVTPKLDGFAAYHQKGKLYTRGDGRNGTDISWVVNRLCDHIRIDGPGEIVVEKEYFEKHLSGKYENTRNVIASFIKEGELEPEILDAALSGAIVFKPFSELNGWGAFTYEELLSQLELIWETNNTYGNYDTDGLVIEVTSDAIKAKVGHTNHHHRWQIAFKKNTEFHDIEVTDLVWQTSKNGRLTPVVLLTPTKISGVTISRATGHHYGNVKNNMIERGAVVRVCRSGLVIPYIERVITPAKLFVTPGFCPSCAADTEIDGDNLLCSNDPISCPAQVEGMIEFFFQTLGNIDGFGPKVIEQICEKSGASSLSHIYSFKLSDLKRCGFGEKTALNLFQELSGSLSRPIEDWRFLAAFSIHNVGKGGCERLLQKHKLEDVFGLTIEDIKKIDGFSDKKAESLVRSLKNIKSEFDKLYELGFNLQETPRGEIKKYTKIYGKQIVFTGSMQTGSREEMKKKAKELGAIVGESVSSKTNFLVCGANVGANKTSAAEKHGVMVLTESEWLELIA
jgi:DNA ligase (NAD+)